MPIYEYRCGACGHELEVLQKLSDPPLADCPECHASSLTKLVSAAGFQLKGSGWYATDFKGSGKPTGKEKSGDGESKSSESKSESGESKSTANAETSASSGGCGGNCSCH